MKKYYKNKFAPTYLIIDIAAKMEYYYSFFKDEKDELGRELKYTIMQREFIGWENADFRYYSEISFEDYQKELTDNLLIHLENLTKK